MLSSTNAVKKTIFSLLIICLFYAKGFSARLSSQTIYTLIKNNEANISSINSKVNSMQDNYVSLYRQIDTMKRELAIERQRNERLEKTINNLKTQLQQDRELIKKNIDSVITRVSQETSKAISQASRQKSNNAANNSQNGPPSGNYTVYKVQPGATLSAIAKAYDVSVSSIKSANNLKSDMIRVGEKLYIPQ